MPTCRKCNADLHDDAKVCIECGTRTPLGGGFDFDDNFWRPKKWMYYAAGGVVFVILLAILINVLHVDPPDVVAAKWFECMANRQVKPASELVTGNYHESLQQKLMDIRAVSDEYYTEVSANGAKYEIGKPAANGKTCEVIIMMNYPEGEQREMRVNLVKQGRRWLVNDVI